MQHSITLQAKEGSSGDEDRVRQQLSLTESLDSVAVSLAAAEKHLSQHASMLPIYEVRSLQAAFKVGFPPRTWFAARVSVVVVCDYVCIHIK